MASTEDPKGAETPPSESSPENGAKLPSTSEPAEDSYSYIDDGYPTEDHSPQAPTMTVEPGHRYQIRIIREDRAGMTSGSR